MTAYNPKIKKGINIIYSNQELPYFVEWKMNGVRDYVLGLEPGNCLPDGRNVMRTKNMLDFIKPNEKKEFNIKIEILE